MTAGSELRLNDYDDLYLPTVGHLGKLFTGSHFCLLPFAF
jgi:hypothetical protein